MKRTLSVTSLESASLLTTCSHTLRIYKAWISIHFASFITACYGFKYPAVLRPKKLNEKLAACTASLEYVIRHTAGCARNSILSREGMDITCNIKLWL